MGRWSLGLCALAFGLCPVRGGDIAPPVPLTHVTDAEDKLLPGNLNPTAEKRSRANALYATAMLLPDGAASDLKQALDLYRQVVALDPTFTEAQLKLANLLLQNGQLDEAYRQLVALAKAQPESLYVQVELGYTQKLRGQKEAALRLCAKALATDATQTMAMRVILEIAAEDDDLSGGVVHVKDILKAGGAHVPVNAWLALDRLYQEYARGQMNGAGSEAVLRTRVPILEQAVSLSPADGETLTLLAKAYLGLGRRLDALQMLQRASALDASNTDLFVQCAEIESDLGRKGDAIRDYEKAFAANPSLQGLRERLGNLYLDTSRFEKAAHLYELALAESPHDPGLEIDLGIALEGMHQAEKAQACFDEVFNSLTCPPEAYLELAFFQLQRKEYGQAGRTLASARKHFPQSARILFYQSVQERFQQKYDAALAGLAQVRSLAVGQEASVLDQNFYSEYALELNLAGKKDGIEPLLREALGRYPDDAGLMNELAYFWAEQGTHLPEALALSRRAETLDPDNGPIEDTRGWVSFQMGETRDALPYLQRAAIMTNNDPVVLQHVGDAYWRLGQRREALATWAQALRKDPHNGDLAKRIVAAQAQAKNAHLRSAPRP